MKNVFFILLFSFGSSFLNSMEKSNFISALSKNHLVLASHLLGETPLTIIIKTIKELKKIEDGINHYRSIINEPNTKGETPLFIAIKKSKEDPQYLSLVKLMLEENADVTHEDLEAAQGNSEILRLLTGKEIHWLYPLEYKNFERKNKFK